MDYGRLSLRGLLRGYSEGGYAIDRRSDWEPWRRVLPFPDRQEEITMWYKLQGWKTYLVGAVTAAVGGIEALHQAGVIAWTRTRILLRN